VLDCFDLPRQRGACLLPCWRITGPLAWFFQSLQALAPEAWVELINGWTREQKDNVLQFLTALLQNGTAEQQRDAATALTILIHGTRDWICPPENACRRQS
jgi:hypothetical protein